MFLITVKIHWLRKEKQYLIGVFFKNSGKALLYGFYYSFTAAGYVKFSVDILDMSAYSFITDKRFSAMALQLCASTIIRSISFSLSLN
jgi:hypothetical protein